MQQTISEAVPLSGGAFELTHEMVVAGSERVYDDARDYERGSDYEVEYSTGTIRPLQDSPLTDTESCYVDYKIMGGQ